MNSLYTRRFLFFVTLFCYVLAGAAFTAELADQPDDRTSYFITADGKRIYDDELAGHLSQLMGDPSPGSFIFVFTQCSSGGMLDDLAEALPSGVAAALLSACRYGEDAWMAASWDPSGCLAACGLSRPESYYAAALTTLISNGLPLGEIASLIARRDPAAPGGPATDPSVCPGESQVNPPEHPQAAFLGPGKDLRLGRDPFGGPIPSDRRVAIIVAGAADTVAMWNDLDRFYNLLLGHGFTPERVLVLGGQGAGSRVELSDPEGETLVVPAYVDAAATREEVLSSLEWGLAQASPGGQLVFWYTGHGDEERRIPWAEAYPLAPDMEMRGTLESTDDTLLDGSFYDLYVFQGDGGRHISLSLSSQEFDAFLWLYDSARQVVTTDDDGGGGTDARIELTLPETGLYYVLANAYEAGETGEYTLTLTVQDLSRGEEKENRKR